VIITDKNIQQTSRQIYLTLQSIIQYIRTFRSNRPIWIGISRSIFWQCTNRKCCLQQKGEKAQRLTTPDSRLKVNRRFGETYRLHYENRRMKKSWNQHEAGTKHKMEATCSAETSLEFQRNAWRYIPEGITHNHRCRTSNPANGNFFTLQSFNYACSVVGWGTMLQTGRSPVQVPDKMNFFNPSSRTMALGSTQPLTEMSTRNLPGG
jgi:hypothetical protein